MENSRSSHETIRMATILVSFFLGWIITAAGFMVPPMGVVDNSIIIIFGQAMTYCAVGLGMKDYTDTKILEHMKKTGENAIE